MHVFKHPKYYKELRSIRNKSGQAISDSVDPASGVDSVRPGQGHKHQAASDKQQAASDKLQAPSDSSNKLQASSPKRQASSSKPQATSSKILEPR